MRPARTEWLVQVWEADAWCAVAAPYSETDRPAALARLHQRQQRFPDEQHRLIRRTTTYTLEDTQP
ncbi:hypothetical protein [Streptomyces sp. NPDC001404]|uniref:hypothetical protein n=1 Tax=Streptomyces sp. NPDC001404 TaxID=3364571 RepID=UPI003689DE84